MMKKVKDFFDTMLANKEATYVICIVSDSVVSSNMLLTTDEGLKYKDICEMIAELEHMKARVVNTMIEHNNKKGT
jgi:hypothetical protein